MTSKSYICGRRYVDRVEDTTEIKVYTNQKTGDKVFCFQVPIFGEYTFEARSGKQSDSKN